MSELFLLAQYKLLLCVLFWLGTNSYLNIAIKQKKSVFFSNYGFLILPSLMSL